MKRKILGSILAVLLTATVVYAASWKTTDTEDSSVNGGEIVMVENEGGTDNNWMSLTTIKTWVLNALSAASVAIVDSGNNFTATNVETGMAELADEIDALPTLTWGIGLTDTSNTISVTYPVTAEAFGAGWDNDGNGATKNDVYDFMVAYDLETPSTLNLTTDTSVTEAQLLASKFISNQGASGEVDITLPAVSYSITRTVLITEAQIAEINPPSGEAFDLSGTALDANDCIDSPATVGAKAVFTRMQNASGTWHWSVDTVRGSWVDTGATD